MDLLLILALAGALYALVQTFQSWLDAHTKDPVWDELHLRARALDALAGFSQSEKIPATDRCKGCAAPILTENTPFGYCSDCVTHLVVDDGTWLTTYCLPQHLGYPIDDSVMLLPADSHRLDVLGDTEPGTVAYFITDPHTCRVHGEDEEERQARAFFEAHGYAEGDEPS
jgi:hypothetical protein